MKTIFKIVTVLFLVGCHGTQIRTNESLKLPLSQEFKSYWFDGTAEISSFSLIQSRYGSPRDGMAVLIFVTEDFLPDRQVKANQKSQKTQTVLKLNRTKNFNTGIYPYSIMNSSFGRLGQYNPLVKITTSIQEWCGQSYLQLNRRSGLNITSHSYFEGEADQKLEIQDALTEDELWHWVRTHPDQLPQGSLKILPAFEFLRLYHKPIQLYTAIATLDSNSDYNMYHLEYPELNRKLSLIFEKKAPYQIVGWEEHDLNNPQNTTRAKRIKKIKLPYWKLNRLGDETFRDSLGLN
ncbi:MAG: septum formation inhibitor Maf [Flavobacteriaceae bacterium]